MRAAALAAALAAGVAAGAGPAAAEQVVADISQNRIAITANFDGSEILVFGAVRREAPPPGGPLDVVIAVEGPPAPVTVRRKARRFGIWVNAESVEIDHAPSYYAVASTGPLAAVLSETEDLRHRISIPRAIRAVGVAHQAPDAPAFTEALIRLRRAAGAYETQPGAVELAADTLFRADFVLPANLTEGLFRVRIFLLRDGRVADAAEIAIDVQKEGLERMLHRMAFEQPLAYGLLSLVIAAVAGWGASAAFVALRR
jgi:uncharacterized protein (TIGR02186 family)